MRNCTRRGAARNGKQMQHGGARSASYANSPARCVAPRARHNSPRAASEREQKRATCHRQDRLRC
eukprot:14677539-Alexandrium_andersonii.AAC.1